MFSVIALLVIYKMQHIKPVDDPKDSPLFQQRLKSSLDKFQKDEFPARPDKMQNREMLKKRSSSDPRQSARTKDLVVAGRCGRLTLTWAEGEKIDKESIKIKRKTQDGEYSLLKGSKIYDRAEEGGGTRYWASDSKLKDGTRYEYLISFKGTKGKEMVKGPASINLTCNERDKAIVAQREKKLKEYYQKKGVDVKDYAAKKPSYSRPAQIKDLVISGRCGRVTLTWVEEEKKINKESIKIKRKTQDGEYSLLKGKRIYDREEEGGGTRYWSSDSEIKDGVRHEYIISFKDSKGKEVVKGPDSINLTCNERDKEILAQREKMLKEYYQKSGVKEKDSSPMRPPSYQLSKEVYNIKLGNSPRKGRKDAPVNLVVFTDFECIHCSTWAETLDTMLKTFPRDVKIVFKNYPLPYHKQAELAATAALAASEQGKFWEMHDLLFKNYNALSKEDIMDYAKSLEMDISKFKNSLKNNDLQKVINRDSAQGKTLGVQNAPTTFINGRRFVGSPPVSYIKGLIEDILENN